ncbi:DNA cytosine methyltransferase [Lacrimispora sphenoides]|uniref:DNA cytosine methyltransferase n=1 Tax=Lacrimispora sphenoides TaxID=29370 RepID=UPI000B87723F|nr:DNA (cytosine-5-)-methyltransferase [Lacrimispora sphenoides]
MELTDCTGNRQLTHLSLFSGIGGLDLAAEWAGFESVGQCEWADYPTQVLEKHWPDVPRWRDIRTLNGESFYERTNRRTVDIISGGFPCQPFSVAGKQRGKDDDRYLWPEMVRVIKELRPAWVVGENVAGIINMALDTVLSDLEAAGYTVRTFVLPACGVNAPHQRYRTAIVAYTKGNNTGRLSIRESEEKPRFSKCSKDVADTSGIRYSGTQSDREPGNYQKRNDQAYEQGGRTKPDAVIKGSVVCNTTSQGLQNGSEKSLGKQREKQESKRSDWWAAEPGVGRVANGVPHRVDRIKCLGNAVVPAQFYPIFQAIADIELHR